MDEKIPRKLAAILYADVAGYGRLTGEDEEGTHRVLSEYLDLFTAAIEGYEGRVVHFAGDAILAEFPGVSQALSCAAAVQRDLQTRNAALPEERRVRFRTGVNLGEVIVDRDDLYGDGVNVAARLEALAEPGGICVSESVRHAAGARLPFSYEFLGEKQAKNIREPVRAYRVCMNPDAILPAPGAVGEPRRGIRRRKTAAGIVAALAVVSLGVLGWFGPGFGPWAPATEPASVERRALPLPDKPSIAVLPFDNLTGSDDEAYLADGFTENIITELSRFTEFFVIARNSTFAYKGEPVRIRQVAEDLGVRYVVEGSVQAESGSLRVTAQLIDAISGTHLWAERFDRDVQDFFAVQDEITRTIVATLNENISRAEQDRVRRKPPESVSAYETRRRAQAAWLTYTPDGNERARRLYEKTAALDPEYAEAYVGLAWVHVNGYRFGWSGPHTREESLALALEMARKAVELDPFNDRAHWVLGKATMLDGDLDGAITAHDRALELNPNSADVLADSAEVLVYVGRAEDAVSRMKAAIRLNPRHPDWYLWTLGWAQYHAGSYEDGLSSIRRMSTLPNLARRTLAALLVRLGRIERARAVIAEFRKNTPDYGLGDLKVYPYENREDLEFWMEDLRKAGLPHEPSTPKDPEDGDPA